MCQQYGRRTTDRTESTVAGGGGAVYSVAAAAPTIDVSSWSILSAGTPDSDRVGQYGDNRRGQSRSIVIGLRFPLYVRRRQYLAREE
jgi:hypothetical protein